MCVDGPLTCSVNTLTELLPWAEPHPCPGTSVEQGTQICLHLDSALVWPSVTGEGGGEATLQPSREQPVEGPTRGPSSSWLWLCCSHGVDHLWSHGPLCGKCP